MNYKQLPHKEITRGMKFWRNPNNNFSVLALHYTADPKKDPERDGKEWYNKEREGTPKAVWNKEYEIDFTTKSGKLVFGPDYCDFNPGHHFIDSFNVKGENIISLDFGQQNPTAALVGVYTKEGILYIVDEYYKPAIPSVSSREMFDKFSYLFSREEIDAMTIDEKRDLANDFFQIRVIDPTTRAKNRVKKEYGEEIEFSVLEDFYDNGWDFELGSNNVDAGITRIREYFQIRNNNISNLYIFKDKCPNLCRELVGYKYKELGEGQGRTMNHPEKPVKKDDHTIDALKYMIMTRPARPEPPKKKLTTIQKDIRNLIKPSVSIEQSWDID